MRKAGEEQSEKIVKFLFKESIHKEYDLHDVLRTAILKWKSFSLIKMLLESPYSSQKMLFACLRYSVDIHRLEVSKWLIDVARVNVNETDEYGYTLLTWGAHFGILQNVKYLIEELNADINSPGREGETALHRAAFKGGFAIVDYLISKHCDLNLTNTRTGMTPLAIASKEGHLTIVKTLIKSGADFTKPNLRGQTPFEIATKGYEEGCKETAKYLKSVIQTSNKKK